MCEVNGPAARMRRRGQWIRQFDARAIAWARGAGAAASMDRDAYACRCISAGVPLEAEQLAPATLAFIVDEHVALGDENVIARGRRTSSHCGRR